MIKLLIVGAVVIVVISLTMGFANPPGAKRAGTAVLPVSTNASTTATSTTSVAVSQTESTSSVLDQSGEGLVSVSMEIFNRTELQELDLSNNELQGSLLAEIRLLQNLTVLNLSNNNFTGVPAEIGQLQNLEILNLSFNSITGLPRELGNLSKLKTLDLRGNDYSGQDLAIIKKSLPDSTEVLVD